MVHVPASPGPTPNQVWEGGRRASSPSKCLAALSMLSVMLPPVTMLPMRGGSAARLLVSGCWTELYFNIEQKIWTLAFVLALPRT